MRLQLERMKRNLRVVYAMRALAFSTALLHPGLASWWAGHGLKPKDYLVLEAVFFGSLFAAQSKTGRIADALGRKKALTIGGSLFSVGMLPYFLCPCFMGFIASEVTTGVALAFNISAEEAIFTDSLAALKLRHKHSKLWGWTISVGFISAIFWNVLGGKLLAWNTKLPFMLCGFFFLLYSLLATTLTEAGKKRAKTREGAAFLPILRQCLVEQHEIRWIVFLGAFMNAPQIAAFWISHRYLLDLGLSPEGLGVLLAGQNLTIAMSSKAAPWLSPRLGIRGSALFPAVLAGAGLLSLSAAQGPLSAVVLLLPSAARGYCSPTYSAYINCRVESQRRATVLSVRGAVETGCTVLMLAVTWAMVEQIGLANSFALLGCFALAAGFYMASRAPD